MKTVTAKKRRSHKIDFIEILKVILQYTAVAIGSVMLLIAIYQVFKLLFVVAVLILAWVFPRR